MTRSTVDNTIQRIRRQASSGYRFEFNLLASAVTASVTTIPLDMELTAAMQAGSVICVGLETMRVRSISIEARTCEVIRGWYDSDPVVHSAGDEVWINPRFTPIDIYDAMAAELQSWGPALYRPFGATFAVQSSNDIAELPATFAGMYGLISVRAQQVPAIPGGGWPDVNVRFQRGTGWTGLTTSGLVLRFIDGVADGNVHVMAAMPFSVTALTLSADLVTGIGLQESMLDVLEMGVKLRLETDNEIGRSARTAQDEPRRAVETPVGAQVTGFQFANAMYRTRKQDEVNKLRAQYPIRYS